MVTKIIMRVLTLKPEEGTVTLFRKDQDLPEEKRLEPFIKGKGIIDYVCGLCEHVLIEAIFRGQVEGIVFECPNCGAYNQIE